MMVVDGGGLLNYNCIYVVSFHCFARREESGAEVSFTLLFVVIVVVVVVVRVYSLGSLKRGEKDILVATDVAGRGIDIR